MKQKKLLLLGGSRFLFPVIKKAKELGIFIMTADYLPDNDAHKFSDRYYNVSIIDKDAVLEVAQKENIDGIMSFACDPGVTTAAYVAEKMGLNFQCSYEAATILQNKVKFRDFLRKNNFNVPNSIGFTSKEEALKHKKDFQYPLFVKPSDSAGSKGVSKVEDETEYESAIEKAFANSISKIIIVEDFLDIVGAQSSTDMFTVNGVIANPLFSDQIFDKNATNSYVPTIEIWPSTMPLEFQSELENELNRLFSLLKCKNGIYNIECRVCSNNKTYIMEVSPRGGGNHIAYIQDLAYGLNYIENEIRNAINMPLVPMSSHKISGVWCTYSLHSNGTEEGYFDRIDFDETFKNQYIKFVDIGMKKMTKMEPFTGANMSLGDIFLHFPNRNELCENLLADQINWMNIIVKNK